ncbi:hypothetical protein MF672_005160 [Actinomadura sp. ATCC 31491]|uniref:Uncharacterized protein n=1 Tax=Actinomadura luzonensis TaxID=2805427 RepID=A0ABT0FLM8_9ACTN|nr:hypothetical protein [Actinomadura luzonensis]MCK2213187.1 hypothetical protein [Actinomadura luzonensis]
MVAIGFALLGVGLVVAVLLALADPVLVSRLDGEPAGRTGKPGTSEESGVVRLAPRQAGGGDRRASEAA